MAEQQWETVSVRGTGFAPKKQEELVPPPSEEDENSVARLKVADVALRASAKLQPEAD
jgi:hypothetical protein